MIRHISLEEDIALKRLATTPLDQKPGFAWREAPGRLVLLKLPCPTSSSPGVPARNDSSISLMWRTRSARP